MMPTALVCVRITPGAKGRLAHVLSVGERIDLMRRSFVHVVGVLLDAGLSVIGLSPTDVELPVDIEMWRDEGRDLNESLCIALERLGMPALVVHADLPLLTADEVDVVSSSPADVVVARSRDGGTNGLLLRRAIRPAFGPGSALEHARRARAVGLRVAVVDMPGFAMDVDDEASLIATRAATTDSRASSSRRRLP